MGATEQYRSAGVPPRRRRLVAALSVIALALGGTLAAQAVKPSAAQAFGTINGLGQRSEHERITRAALACAPG
ncbi:hypothetical protein ACFQ9X_26580 [Catenulispora yoronensis]